MLTEDWATRYHLEEQIEEIYQYVWSSIFLLTLTSLIICIGKCKTQMPTVFVYIICARSACSSTNLQLKVLQILEQTQTISLPDNRKEWKHIANNAMLQ